MVAAHDGKFSFARQLAKTQTCGPADILYRHESQSMVNSTMSKSSFGHRGTEYKKGQTLVEYALILALISVVAIAVLIGLGSNIKNIFTTISSQIAIANSSH
jgi:pilus assembly protein Flp/PilA